MKRNPGKITNGGPGMPAFGSTLNDDDIAEVVRYVRGLSRGR